MSHYQDSICNHPFRMIIDVSSYYIVIDIKILLIQLISLYPKRRHESQSMRWVKSLSNDAKFSTISQIFDLSHGFRLMRRSHTSVIHNRKTNQNE